MTTALTCTCRQLPHKDDCPVAEYFSETEGITLDSEQEDYHDQHPFIIQCPRGCRFGQFTHAVGYNYERVSGETESTEIPMVCPVCGWSDKQTLPDLVGFDPNADVEDEHFIIYCPACETPSTREDGTMSLWLEKAIVKGMDELKVGGMTYYRGQTYSQFTELSIECFACGYQCGETED